jgi:NACHT domain-containing protein
MMDYALENLGPERFQEVCHALLAKAFPTTQCFPVGQRDGGRDAISFIHADEAEAFIVYQVKYARKPLAEKDAHQWLTQIVSEEAPKLKSLVPKGASRYYLLTNVPGTAFPDSGSIDAVQKILGDNLDVPAQCLWRDDLNRRLDDSWNIKWSYPEILTGPDILRHIIESGLSQDAERRTSAIRAFVRDQYDRDAEVRFKQVELQNRLLDLFIDVPVDLREASKGRYVRNRDAAVMRAIAHGQGSPPGRAQEETVGAATLLLHPLAQSYLRRVVVEGAPGQGKSTIAQYICQVHRQRILSEGAAEKRVPQAHHTSPVRLPFKIDCRDFSLWLSKQNPFSADDTATVPVDWQKSLESFLAAQIANHSGGASFTVSDLHAVAKLSAVLLVFDGLDEVADIGRRREVVDQIAKGTNRLDEVAVSVQAIVTSRPAAFANSPGMPEDSFRYFHLVSIDRPLIDEYAEKWLRARRLDGREAADVRRILRDKLDQPHLRELARNPMQLAILLSLIQTRGGSLPDKRTALYDSYVELFFNREAEKSSVVRDHRDLLIDIHRYLAWVLHAESQTKRNRGSASADRLRQLVVDYLASEGHDTALGQLLFTGMVERVVALVSRVQGTYEFEVQPLREYFAARHLYNTAPYSPPGNPQKGTLPERFDALCRDFYWQNVTRFYAGCYSKGELPSLVDRLEDLARSPGYKHTSHPQALAATLLSDWVFAQHPKSMKQVVSLILDGIGLRQVTAVARWNRRDDILVLPKQSGNEELVERCFELLASGPPSDFARLLAELIRVNTTRDAATSRWLAEARSLTGADLTRWIRYGLSLGVLSNLDDLQVEALFEDTVHTAERLTYLLRAGQLSFVEVREERLKVVVGRVLARNPDMVFRRVSSVVDAFIQAISPHRYAIAFQHRSPIPLRECWHRYVANEPEVEEPPPIVGETAAKCREVILLGHALAGRQSAEWAKELGPWNELVESARELFGDQWALQVLANVAAGVRSKNETCDEAVDLHAREEPLCRRVRYARLRAGVSGWWESQLLSTTDEEDVQFALLVLITWAGPTVLNKHADLLDEKLRSLSTERWLILNEALQNGSYRLDSERRDISLAWSDSQALSERTIVALGTRVSEGDRTAWFRARLRNYSGNDQAVLEFCQRSALIAALEDPMSWEQWLPVMAGSYGKGITSDRYYGHKFARAIQSQSLPQGTAEHIMTNCESYPAELVEFAEHACRTRVAEQVVPVGLVAEQQSWF